MLKRVLVPLVLALAALAVVVEGAGAAPVGAKDLARPAAPAANPAARPGASLKTVIALVELQHPRGLNRFVRAVSDPRSARYRQYASVTELVERFGAPKSTRKRVTTWLAARGLHGTVSPTGAYVTVPILSRRTATLLPRRGTGAVGAGAGKGLGRRVPAALRGAVTRINLLSARPAVDKYVHSFAGSGAAAASAAKPSEPYRSILPHTGTAEGCPAGDSGGIEPGLEPFTPNQYLQAYGFSEIHTAGFTGHGQSAAVVETGGFKRSDILTFGKCFGFGVPPTTTVPVGVKGPLPPEDETTLDLEMLSAGAPGLDRIRVYEGSESLAGVLLTAGAALGAPGSQPSVISISLGFCEPELAGSLVLRDAFDNVFAVAAGAGISVLVSSGDQGSSGCRIEDPATEAVSALPIAAVSLPASSPYVTAVGGTNLILTKANQIKKELVWNDAVLTPWAGGGGGSIISPRTPWWQEGISRYGLGRKVPDIAALADLIPGYAFYCTAKSCLSGSEAVHGWISVGGTSAAAPLMASGVALADEYAGHGLEGKLGFLNPLLYQYGANAETRAELFTDVVDGNNDIGRALPAEAGGGKPIGCCSAAPGYDWASGWGSLQVPGLLNAAIATGQIR